MALVSNYAICVVERSKISKDSGSSVMFSETPYQQFVIKSAPKDIEPSVLQGTFGTHFTIPNIAGTNFIFPQEVGSNTIYLINLGSSMNVIGGSASWNYVLSSSITTIASPSPTLSVDISYKGESIASLAEAGTKTLLCRGKYMEDDITIAVSRPEEGT